VLPTVWKIARGEARSDLAVVVVEIGHREHCVARASTARRVDYTPATPDVPFECFTLGELRGRVGGAELGGLQQLHFDMIIACSKGRAAHEVDFETATIDRHRWLHIRPGQVHRWIDSGYDADLVLLARSVRSPHWSPGPRIIELDNDQLHDIGPLLDLARHQRRTDVGASALHALRDLLVRWLAFDRPEHSESDPLYADFRRLLDNRILHARNVEHCATHVNCSARTLARSCRRVGAPSPKTLIDEAALLEAQRLLALPSATVTATSATLGFDEVTNFTNFTKFFKRVGGETPSAWQAAHQINLTDQP